MELISRQQAIETFKDCAVNGVGIDGIVDALKQLPPIQPEIVRCKDCKHYGRADKRRFFRGYDCLDGRIASIVPDKDFCSRAERREVTI